MRCLTPENGRNEAVTLVRLGLFHASRPAILAGLAVVEDVVRQVTARTLNGVDGVGGDGGAS
jgi:hypothetical protein